MVRVAVVQMRVEAAQQENYERSLVYIEQAAQAGAQLVCFPEGQLSPYLPQYAGLDAAGFAITLDHPYIQGFCDCCRRQSIIASIAVNLLIDGCIYPSNLVISEDGHIVGIGKKNHIVRADHFYEQDYFTPGQEGFTVVDTSIGRIGMVVCFDRHYPESFRTCALKGADLVVVPVANERIEPTEIFHWEMRIAAFQNSVHVIMCNRVGQEGAMDFNGHSLVAQADGTVAAASSDKEGLILAALDMEQPKQLRQEKQYLPLLRKDAFF